MFDLGIPSIRRHFFQQSGKASQGYARFFGKFTPLNSRMHGYQFQNFCLITRQIGGVYRAIYRAKCRFVWHDIFSLRTNEDRYAKLGDAGIAGSRK